jgi:hypothetical protein
MPNPRRIPMVRPPLHAAGGVGDPFGNSGAPGMPPPDREGDKAARDEMIQRYALARGRWFERVFVFPDFAIMTAASGVNSDAQQIDVKSNGDSFVRLVAMRGVVNTFGSFGAGNNFEAKNTFLQLEIDGLEDFTTSGKTVQPISFDAAFSENAAPWLWLSAPPILRVGETVAATVSMILAQIPSDIGWQAQLAFRLVDDNVWCELYGY